MKERNIILRAVVPAAVALLIFAGLVLAIDVSVSITPKSLSLNMGNPTWVRCYVNVAPYNARDVDKDNCTLDIEGADPISADKVGCEEAQGSDVVVFFNVDDVRSMLEEAKAMGKVELTLTITVEGGDTFVGSDMITVRL
ncbi:MAG: hypothetical protein MUO22_06750 [Sedimentisphaerales bacterium]|nr:hypothetical protein [Sedimentisphaerales bacterium]